MSECVCVCVCHHKFVWLGLFLCMLIRYMGFMGIWTPAVLSFLYIHVFCIFVFTPVSAIELVSRGKAL